MGERFVDVGAQNVFMLGDWRVEPSLNRISHGGEEVKLEPLNMKLLMFLANRPGAVISHDEIERAVWTGLVVTPGSIYQSIAQLRRALGDDKAQPRYIETVARRGYRLVALIRLSTENSSSNVMSPSTAEAVLPQAGEPHTVNEAEGALLHELELLHRVYPELWRIARAKSALGEALLGQGRIREAEVNLVFASRELDGVQGWMEGEARQATAKRMEQLQEVKRASSSRTARSVN
jgi:DNA-binding winged helix-turn-helix (wHTH) protein